MEGKRIRGQIVQNPQARIEKFTNIDPQTGCWEWQGAKNIRGYGRLVVGSRTDKTRRTTTAHRYSYKTFVGDIPYGLWVLHKCDNPSCVNPEHLFLGDRQANVNDRERKKRNKTPNLKHENHPNSKLIWSDVAAIRTLHKGGMAEIEIAKSFKVSRRAVNDIINRITWRPEPPKGEDDGRSD